MNSSATTLFDPAHMELRRDAFARLCLSYDGQRFDDVRVVRAFPLTHPSRCIVFRDPQGNELGVLPDMHHLHKAARALIEDALNLTYFATRVLAITRVTSSHGFTTWYFETSRGACTAYVRDRSDIRWLSAARVVFTDVNGMKFEIPDVNALDERSLTLLDAET